MYIFNIFIIFTLSYSINSQKIITIPFEEYSYNTEKTYESILDFFKSQFHTNIYTLLKIGTPPQTLPTLIKTEEIILMIREDKAFYNKTDYGYNPKISSSFINITALDKSFFYYSYSLINESINFCKDENCKNIITFPNFQLNLIPLESYDNIEKPIIGQLGFLITATQSTNYIKTIYQLKKGGYISSYKFSIKFKDEHKGFLIVGEDPHIYDSNNFKEYQKLTTYMEFNNADYYLYHKLKMDDIYFYNEGKKIIFLTTFEIKFYFDYGIILAPSYYYTKIKNLFFDKYDKICNQSTISVESNSLIVYNCQVYNFNVSEFPSLYFYNKEMNYTFELNYNDLFYKNGDEYIFLIGFIKTYELKWYIGKPFLKKYQLTFDLNSKTISYYDTTIKNENEKSDKGKTLFLVVIIVVIVVISSAVLFIGGYFVGKKLNEVRKKRANELGDDFEYTNNDNENNDQLCVNQSD